MAYVFPGSIVVRPTTTHKDMQSLFSDSKYGHYYCYRLALVYILQGKTCWQTNNNYAILIKQQIKGDILSVGHYNPTACVVCMAIDPLFPASFKMLMFQDSIRLDLSWVDIHVSWRDSNHEFFVWTARHNIRCEKKKEMPSNDNERGIASNPASLASSIRQQTPPPYRRLVPPTSLLPSAPKKGTQSACHSFLCFLFLKTQNRPRESNLDADDGPCGRRIAGSQRSSSIGCWRADEMLLLLLLGAGCSNGGAAVIGRRRRRWWTVQQLVRASG